MNRNQYDREEALHWLGFEHFENPSQEEIKKAWRSQAKKYHPDISNLDKIDAEEIFRKVLDAYQFLSDDTEKEFERFEDDLVERARKHYNPVKKQSPWAREFKPKVLHLGTISLPIFYFLFLGEKYSFNITAMKPCTDCVTKEKSWISCKICDETGEVLVADLFGVNKIKCKQCKGEGWIRKSGCDICKNTMKINTTKNLSFSVPKNYILGTVTTLNEGGNEGRSESGPVTFALQPKISALSVKENRKLYDLLKPKDGNDS